jgi:predicted GNAT superfamily acetyltransferase
MKRLAFLLVLFCSACVGYCSSISNSLFVPNHTVNKMIEEQSQTPLVLEKFGSDSEMVGLHWSHSSHCSHSSHWSHSSHSSHYSSRW